MQKRLWSCVGIAGVAAIAACNNYGSTGPITTINLGNPDSLSYVLLPGAPAQPAGVVLTWVPATDPNVTNYVIYGRTGTDTSSAWGTIAYTGETTFFDVAPVAQYYVASEDGAGDISSGTSPVTVDTSPPMAAPGGLAGVGIDSGAKLTWSDSVRLANATIFSYYRVYSEMASGASCPNVGNDFGLEGTTVSENFVVTGIANGTAVCYGVTTVSSLGQESALSSWTMVTPSSGGGSFDIATSGGATVVVHRARHASRRATVVVRR